MEKTEFSNNLNAIYNDILSIKIDSEDSFKTSTDKFYEIMRKYGICQGTWSENGRLCNNAEWNMCFSAFRQHKILSFDMFIMLSEPPEDLLAYGERPILFQH